MLNKKIILNGLIIGSISLSGCAGYYQSQTAYYQAQSDAATAYLKASQRPIAEMVAPDGTRFVVNQTAIQMPIIKESNNPVVEGVKNVVNSTPAAILSGAVLAGQVLKNSIGDSTVNGSNNQSTSNITPTTTDTVITSTNQETIESVTNSYNPISTTDNHTTTNPSIVTGK